MSSQVAAEAASGPASASATTSEKNATPHVTAATPSTATASTPKPRSCLVCRSRKVRCDKQSPCSNCRRANIACVLPSTGRTPRWVRRFERSPANHAARSNSPASADSDPRNGKVMDRLRSLEALVKELRAELEQAESAGGSGGGAAGGGSIGSSNQDRGVEVPKDDPSPLADTSNVQAQLGRLVLQGTSRSRYVSSGFWSRVNDELEGLRSDSLDLVEEDLDTSDDEASPGKTPFTQGSDQSPSARYAFLFRHNLSLSAPDLHELHPLPSQIPFLLDVFNENVNFFIRIVHVPALTKMVRVWRGSGMTRLTPNHEALMFSIYYAAVVSMEEEDILTSFGSSKSDLSAKYRLGLEHALAKADFLDRPDIVLVQALVIFFLLLRRHDSPRFVWMMTGMATRMALYLGLQRDGSHFENLSPFEIEMRRRVWWGVCLADLRASEDEGTDLTILSGSFDTKIPLNFDDSDIDPEMKQMPKERDGVTDMSFPRISAGITDVMRQMMFRGARDGARSLEDQNRLLKELWQKFEQEYLRHTSESGGIAYWVGVTCARLIMAKMALIVSLPVLFSSSNDCASYESRTKLLISAIEVAEYNHALNAEPACRQWRWVYQTRTHWHAIVYLLIEITRRPWSPTIERAWVALHSRWLIPPRAPTDKNLRVWVPLRKLMDKASKHRDGELSRLRRDPQAAARVEMQDHNSPVPSSPGPFPIGSAVDAFRERWRQLVTETRESPGSMPSSGFPQAEAFDTSMYAPYQNQSTTQSLPAYNLGTSNFTQTFEPTNLGTEGQQANSSLLGTDTRDRGLAVTAEAPYQMASHNPFPATAANWSADPSIGPGFAPWMPTGPSNDMLSNLNAGATDADMDLNDDMNWYDWVQSARTMESNEGSSGTGYT